MELTLSSSVQYVPRVGPKMASLLEKLGVNTVKDLLYYVPFRYNDYSLVSPIARVQPGETVTIRGEVVSMKNTFTKTGKKLQQAKVSDESGTLDVIWFNQMYLTRIIKPALTFAFSGKVDWFGHSIVLISPEYERFKEDSLHTGRLVPVYSETSGLSSKWLRGRIAYCLDSCLHQVSEFLPETIRKTYGLPDLRQAIRSIHFPQNQHDAKLARRRLAFDEIFSLQLRAYEHKKKWRKDNSSYHLEVGGHDVHAMVSSLPFELTIDQKNATSEILEDFKKPYAMNRFLEGDVGSGKTVVAAIAMYVIFKNNLQSVLMAPTEILAKQHFETLSEFLSPLGVSVGLLTGHHKDKKSDIMVGTHALLFQEFDRVALVVIDEQQRFGVAQRGLLTKKTKRDKYPHVLTMTATPIPRTAAQILYGNMDLSILTQMPKGRMKVKTWVVPKEKRDAAYRWIEKQVIETRAQAFIVCPLIEESETLTTVRAVNKEYKRLKTDVFPTLKLGLLHGRIKAEQKTKVLENFRDQTLDILVTTPVVEVGIDIPHATIMMIEAADRFGLSQLHQLRGRVGRRQKQSYCLLFTELPDALDRLKAMEITFSGPLLAELDLKLRGPGELFGTKQHGFGTLKIARFSDTPLLEEVKEAVVKYTNDTASKT